MVKFNPVYPKGSNKPCNPYARAKKFSTELKDGIKYTNRYDTKKDDNG